MHLVYFPDALNQRCDAKFLLAVPAGRANKGGMDVIHTYLALRAMRLRIISTFRSPFECYTCFFNKLGLALCLDVRHALRRYLLTQLRILRHQAEAALLQSLIFRLESRDQRLKIGEFGSQLPILVTLNHSLQDVVNVLSRSHSENNVEEELKSTAAGS